MQKFKKNKKTLCKTTSFLGSSSTWWPAKWERSRVLRIYMYIIKHGNKKMNSINKNNAQIVSLEMCIRRLLQPALNASSMHYAHICAFIYRLLIKLAVYWQTPYTTLTSSTANALVHFPNACSVGIFQNAFWIRFLLNLDVERPRKYNKKAAPATGGRTIIYVKWL